VTATLNGLDAASTYFWQIVATNNYGTSYGTVKTFLTANAPAALAITSANAGSLAKNASSSIAFAATGGVPSYAWSVTSGSLPTGLTLNSSGTLTGSTSVLGTYTFTVTVDDQYNGSQSMVYTLTVTAPATVTTGNATNVSYITQSVNGATLNGTVNPGNLPTHVWFCFQMDTNSTVSVASCTPVDAMQSPISGTQDVPVSVNITADLQPAKTYYYVVVASNENGDANPVSGTIHQFTTPPAPAAMVISNSSPLSNGVSGSNFSLTFQVQNGTGPYTWSKTAGALPPGLTLDPTSGTIGGILGAIGTYSFTIRVTDANGMQVSKSFQIVIVAAAATHTTAATAISDTAATLNAHVDTGLLDTAVTFCWGTNAALTGCTSTQSQTLTGSSSQSSAAASLTGLTPYTTYYFQAIASNGVGTQSFGGIETFRTTTSGALAIANPSLPNGSTNSAYNAQLSNSNGVAPIVWSATGLPNGLSMSTSGAITGTPTQTGSFTVNVTVTDALPSSVSQSYTIVITAEPTVVSQSATSVNDTSAILHGVINSGYDTTNYYFCYSTQQSLVGCVQTPTAVLAAATTNDPVSASVTGLQTGTVYYFKVVAWNATSGQAVIEGNRLTLNTTSPSQSAGPAPVTPPAPPAPAKPKPLPPLAPVPVVEPPAPGTAPATSGSQPEVTTVVVKPTESSLNVLAKDWSLTVSGADVSGNPTPLNEHGQIVLEGGQYATAKGTGFLPNTEVQVYLFSSPQLIGSVMTDDHGNFVLSNAIPDNLEIGEHTIQVDGYTYDGQIRSSNLLVLVRAAVGKVLTAKFYFDPNKSVISAKNAAAIKALVASVEPGYFDLKAGVLGFVYPYDNKAANLRVSSNRARNVASMLKKLGLTGTILSKGVGRAAQTTKQARRVEVTISYQVKTTDANNG
jgi:outer membrane protein OmpA-like peptidoglycan-associated protein